MSKGWKNAFVRFVHRSRSSSPPSSSSASPNLPPSSDAQPDAAEASHTSPASSPQVAVATSPAAPAPAPTAAAPPSSAPSRHSQETKHMLNIAKLDMLRHDPDIVGTPTRRTSAEVVATASPKTPPTRHSPSALLSKQPGLMAINESLDAPVVFSDPLTPTIDALRHELHNDEELVKAVAAKRMSFSRRRSSSSFSNSRWTMFPPDFHERFAIRDQLGTGAYAEVYRVECRQTKNEFAVKVIFKDRVKDQRRLDTEIEALHKAKHEGIVCLIETFSTEKHLLLLQDLARGGCLFDELISNGGLGELMTSRIMRRMFEAVGYLHTIGIVHRDIKLENILLTDQNNLESVKLSDFGVVRIIEEGEGSLATGKEGEGERRRPVILSQVGSVAYMAPEIFTRSGYDFSVDMWACGVLLYMLLALYSPFGNDEGDEEEETAQIMRIVKGDYNFDAPVWTRRSAQAKDLISKLLVVDPTQRLSAAQALNHPWITNPEQLSIPKLRATDAEALVDQVAIAVAHHIEEDELQAQQEEQNQAQQEEEQQEEQSPDEQQELAQQVATLQMDTLQAPAEIALRS